MPAPAASAAADQAPVPSVEIGGEVPDGPDRLFAGGDPSSPAAEPGDGFVDLTAKSLSADEPMVNLTMFIVAGLLLLAGMCLFGLRWAARRLGDG
jgi:hypothetical protein